MKRNKLIRTAAMLWGLLPITAAGEAAYQFQLTSYSTVSINPSIHNLSANLEPPDYLWQEAVDVRLASQWYVTENGTAELHYQAGLFTTLARGEGDPEFDTGIRSDQGLYRFWDLETRLYEGTGSLDSVVIEQNLDRLNWTQYLAWSDITLGRQAINLGTARFISPADIFRPNSASYLNSDYYPGIDAVRAQVSLGVTSSLDLGQVIGASKQQSAAFMKLKSSVDRLDVSLTGIWLDQKYLLSAGAETSVNEFGLWEELAVLVYDSDSQWRWSIGLDTSLASYLAQIEYHLNQPGTATAQDYLVNASDDPFYEQQAIGYYGEHYIVMSLSWLEGARSGHDASLIVNLDDESVLALLGYSWSMADEWDLNISLNLPLGASPTVVSDELVPQTEFGSYPAILEVKIQGTI